MNTEVLKKYEKAMDRLYVVCLFLILIYELLGSTPILVMILSGISNGVAEEDSALAVLVYQGIVNLRFLIILPAVYNIVVKAKGVTERVVLGGLLVLGWIYSFYMREVNDTYIFRDAMVIAATYGRDYKKILKWSIYLAGGFMCLTVLLNLVGILPEDNLVRDGKVRHSFGTLGPTNLAGHVGFVILSFIFLKEGRIKWPAYVIIAALSILNMVFVDGRTSQISVILATGGCLVLLAAEQLKLKPPEKLMKVFSRCMLLSFVIMSALTLVLVLTYNPDPGVFYNRIHFLESFRGRLENANRVLSVTGVSLLGRYYQNYWIPGQGFIETGNYEFLDSSYARLFIMYGVAGFAVIISLLTFLQYRLMKAGKVFCMFVMAVCSIHFVMEHHILEPAYNIFLILPFAAFKDSSTPLRSARNDKC